ncbi:hypothetical protein ACLOJK_041563 [Asimina triloba]
MATSSFKSTTKRTPIASASSQAAEDTGSSNRANSHRRSRSLGRFSGRFPPPEQEEEALPRGRFVNTVRGSGFPEISLDDLANEFLLSRVDGERDGGEIAGGRLDRRASGVGAFSGGVSASAEASQRRGRSVSRSFLKGSSGNSSASNGISDDKSRRRRSVSVARHQCSDSESDLDLGHNSSSLSKSYSSALTDDEAHDGYNKNGFEKTIRAVYAQKKTEHPSGDGEGNGLYEAMKKEVRHAVDEIRMELEKAIVETKTNMLPNDGCLELKSSDDAQVLAEARKSYATKLVRSEKRTQELLAELAIEEQRSREFSKIFRELLPDKEPTAASNKPSRARKRSNDRTRVSKCLTEEAEKYFEDFISNVEDTDFSSFDGERSDTSSTLGGSIKSKDPVINFKHSEACATPETTESNPDGMDGVILPWLQWETSNDITPLSFNHKMEAAESKDKFSDTSPEVNSKHATSSRASWSPESNDISSTISRGKMKSRFMESGGSPIPYSVSSQRMPSFDMDKYLDHRRAEDLLFERLRQRNRIDSGGLMLCDRVFL